MNFAWTEAMAHCCGVAELGGFHFIPRTQAQDNYRVIVSAPTQEELWPAVFKRMTLRSGKRTGRQRKGAFVHIWFKKRSHAVEYEYQGLMEQFADCPDAIDLGTYINPNTRNRIQGYGVKIHGR